ncbi:CBS domain-containing protein [Colwellia psychrerythraea]|uniref:CBS domain containing membrane protein n=1 Tax=Colwellia psychrerythraea TaxID=28229 RepID=A0A099KE86_COLPS|nr:CBS domain-containing protein [Colwellia psychrerythraea]KGJ88595.1 CBS domain containing membrane protein [Colwellia psychrerythraea]
MTSVRSIMTDDILTLGIENTLSDARIMMVENNIRHIPIVDDKQVLMGLVSQRDVLSVEESTLFDTNENVNSRLERDQYVKIDDFYRRDVVTINAHVSVHNAALTIQKYKIGCLPILSGDKLIGLVTDSDFVNVAINLIEVLSSRETG